MKRLRCRLRSIFAWFAGRRWDGHCWDAVQPDVRRWERGVEVTDYRVVCVDCGKTQSVVATPNLAGSKAEPLDWYGDGDTEGTPE